MLSMVLCSEGMSSERASSSNPWEVTSVHWDLLARRLTIATPSLITRFQQRQGQWEQILEVQDPALKRQLIQAWMAELSGVADPSVSTASVPRIEDEAEPEEPRATDPGPVAEPSDASAESTAATKSPTLIIAGKLQTTPKEGRPDRQGKPTGWARFLGHVADSDSAVLFSATFHGRTRDMALTFQAEDALTAQGYVHWHRASSSDDRRMSTFSVIHLLQYPGKPTRSDAS